MQGTSTTHTAVDGASAINYRHQQTLGPREKVQLAFTGPFPLSFHHSLPQKPFVSDILAEYRLNVYMILLQHHTMGHAPQHAFQCEALEHIKDTRILAVLRLPPAYTVMWIRMPKRHNLSGRVKRQCVEPESKSLVHDLSVHSQKMQLCTLFTLPKERRVDDMYKTQVMSPAAFLASLRNKVKSCSFFKKSLAKLI